MQGGERNLRVRLRDNKESGMKTQRVTQKDAASPPADETSLIEAVAAGDRAAFTTLAQRHMGMMYAVAFRMTGDRHTAEDVVQESLVRLWARAASWNKERGASVKTWLYRITCNMAVDMLRKNKGGVYELPDDSPDEKTVSAETAMQRRQAGAIVRRAVGELPARQRKALVLCHYEGLSNAEAAEILGTTVKGVEGLLVRARRAVQAKLEQHREVL